MSTIITKIYKYIFESDTVIGDALRGLVYSVILMGILTLVYMAMCTSGVD